MIIIKIAVTLIIIIKKRVVGTWEGFKGDRLGEAGISKMKSNGILIKNNTKNNHKNSMC